MYKYIISLLLLMGACLWAPPLAAQEQFRFYHLNTKGYSIRDVYCDVNGIIWLGTISGLISLPQMESNSPSAYQRPFANFNMSIRKISGDNKEGLWLKTLYNDVFYYNPTNNEFVEKTSGMLASKGIDVSREFSVQADVEGNMWVWKENKLYWEDGSHGKLDVIALADGERINVVRSMHTSLLVMTHDNLYVVSSKSKKIVRQLPLPFGFWFRDHLYIDNHARCWIWAENKVWTCEIEKGSVWTLTAQTNSDITGVAQDCEGRYWVSTQSDGIDILASDGSVVTRLRHLLGDAGGLQSNFIEMIRFEESNQTMWVSYTKGGLSVYIPFGQYLLKEIADSENSGLVTDVMAFAPAKGETAMWIGLENRGIYYHQLHTDKHVLHHGSVIALHTSDDGSLWAGIYRHGLLHRTSDGHEYLYFDGESPFAIAEDDNGYIMIALLGKGVWQLDPATGVTTDTRLALGYVFDMKCYKQQLYAASTQGLYVKRHNSEWQQVCDGHYRYMSIDHNGYIWLLGNEGSEGLTVLSPAGQSIEVPNNLRSAPLKSIVIDKDGHAWITTSTELIMLRYHANEKEPWEYSVFKINSVNQQFFYNFHNSYIDEAGILWLGTTKGYQTIDTHRLLARSKDASVPYKLVVGAVTVNDNVLSPGKPFNGRVLLEKDIIFVRDLDLRYNENNLVVECSPLYGNEPPTDIYYYQLKGLSDAWHPFEGYTIVLSNLPPGDYQLFTKTQSSQSQHLLTIHIDPPIWLSWWAFCLYVVVVVLLAYLLLRYYHHRRSYQQKLRELQMQQEQQTQMNEMKLRFFTNISHDLRTPLTLIIGPIEELRNSNIEKLESLTSIQSFNTTVLQPSLEMIHRNALHLLSLVNQILDFRRLEFGKEKPLLSYGNMVSLLNDICNSFRLKAEKENIRLTYAPSMGRLETMLDSDKITKIMMNLLSNAFKFTSAGGSITVTLDVSGGQIIISVTDTGIGISDSDKQHLFERFYQVQELPESTTDAHTHGLSEFRNRTPMGSGIGLHIVREYVHLLGGAITVSDNTEAGHGSTFRFTLPLKKNDGQTTKREDNPGSSLPTLLLVDDNTDMLNYMSQSMGSNFEILTAANGIEAIRLLEEKDVDMIISDIMMPEMDGLEFCQHIKTDFKTSHIPVVLLSAKSMTNDELKGLEAGADDYITKPFSMDILRQRVHNLMERSRQQHERFAKELDIEPSEITVTSLDEQFIAKAISIVESHIAEPDFSVEQLSEEIGIHRAQLYKKLLHLTGKSPQQFVRLLRLKRGKQLLEQSGLYVSEVAYKVGFNSPRIFSKYFKEEFGITPKDFSKQE